MIQRLCSFTHPAHFRVFYEFHKPNPLLNSMSTPSMAELAAFEDAATEAALQAAQASDQAPPVTKAQPPVIQEPPAEQFQSMTHRRNQRHLQGMLIQEFKNGQLISSFQLESMVLVKNQNAMLLDSLSMKVNGLQKNMSKCCVKHLKPSMLNTGIEKLAKKLKEPIEHMLKAWLIGEPVLKRCILEHHPAIPHCPP